MSGAAEAARRWCRGPLGRLAAALALAAALFCAFQLALLAVSGGEPLRLLLVHRPRLLLAAGFAAGCAAWVVGYGARLDRAGLREAAARLALAVGGVALAFLIAEAGLRVALWRLTGASRLESLEEARGRLREGRIRSGHPLAAIIRRSADERLVYEIVPGLDRDFGNRRLRTNSAGLRSDAEFSLEKPAGTVRVVGIGDSGMFGWGVEQDEDYLSVLGKVLNARGDGVRYESINLAVPGYNTQMEVDALLAKGLRYRPDVVVLGWCENDYQLPFMMPQVGQWTRGDLSFLWLLTFQRRRFSDVALVQVRDQVKADEKLVPAYFRENSGEAGVRRSLARLRDAAAREGFRALVFGPFEPRSAAICRESGLACYNTLEQIPKGTWPKEWGVHFMHPRREGHRLLAQRLAAELERLGWVAPPPPPPARGEGR